MGAIVATLLSRLTKACQYSAFFSNEGREMEMLSSGCAVGIACTFSAPVGGQPILFVTIRNGTFRLNMNIRLYEHISPRLTFIQHIYRKFRRNIRKFMDITLSDHS